MGIWFYPNAHNTAAPVPALHIYSYTTTNYTTTPILWHCTYATKGHAEGIVGARVSVSSAVGGEDKRGALNRRHQKPPSI